MFLKLCDSGCDCFTNLAPHYGHLTQVSNISFTKQYTDLTCAAVSELLFCSGAYVYIRKFSQSYDLGKHQPSTLNTVTLLHFFLISLWFCLQRSVAKTKFRPTVKALPQDWTCVSLSEHFLPLLWQTKISRFFKTPLKRNKSLWLSVVKVQRDKP